MNYQLLFVLAVVNGYTPHTGYVLNVQNNKYFYVENVSIGLYNYINTFNYNNTVYVTVVNTAVHRQIKF